MKKLITLILLILLTSSAFPVLIDDIQIKKLDADRLKLFPVPKDNKNYFFLQSVENITQIVIGDFSISTSKKIILITLGKDFNTIKSVTEYDPVKKITSVRKESASRFFTTDITKLKKDIITGTMFSGNFADKMKSYDSLEEVFKRNEATNVLPDTYGFNIKLMEVDEPFKAMAVYTFGKSETGYYLQFKTDYYRMNDRTTIIPVLRYSVYCKDTNDPVIADLVEKLFQIREPISKGADYKNKSN